ncbi:large exoprotein [Microbacterium sp. zg-YB36]|uniref:large exoprotein n=1 Tax=Microbacterium sp. zg-YB36 TaxID=2969407 RepID=UPI00214BBD39|nr:large exoprotein [Microbacterium sp. zg-YB36]MDL5353022.1 large exoprotein [Microbacterium sp. zg-YB36]
MSPYDTDGGMLALIAVFGFIWLLFGIAGYVLTSLFMMKLFDKAGVQGKWRAWVPVYNTMIFAKLGDLNPWWLLIAWVAGGVLSGVGIGWLFLVAASVYTVLAAYRVGLKLQKEPVWLVLYIFLTIVWFGIVAFDKSRWNLAVPPAPWANSFLKDTTVWAGIPAQTAVGGYPAAPGYPGYPQQPTGYQPPAAPAGYQPPAAPAGYQPPAAPAGYQPPAAYQAPAGYQPPAATQPPPYQPPAAPTTPPTEPPAAPQPPTEPPTTEPPAATEPPKQ